MYYHLPAYHTANQIPFIEIPDVYIRETNDYDYEYLVSTPIYRGSNNVNRRRIT